MREDLVGLKIKVKSVVKGGEYNDIIGECGVVERNGSTYGIRIFGKENSSSSYGFFWLSREEFDIITDEECESKEKQKCEMIDGYYIVEVKGVYSKKYSYKCRFDVNVGDKVVCEDEDYIQTIVKVCNLETASVKNPTKEVVCVIDYSEINARKEREEELQKPLDSLTLSEINSKYGSNCHDEIVDVIKKYKDPLDKVYIDVFKSIVGLVGGATYYQDGDICDSDGEYMFTIKQNLPLGDKQYILKEEIDKYGI